VDLNLEWRLSGVGRLRRKEFNRKLIENGKIDGALIVAQLSMIFGS
jgi:hypothetical protein